MNTFYFHFSWHGTLHEWIPYYLPVKRCIPFNAVGADSEEKQELEPELLSANKPVTDFTERCANIGEVHHALKAD